MSCGCCSHHLMPDLWGTGRGGEVHECGAASPAVLTGTSNPLRLLVFCRHWPLLLSHSGRKMNCERLLKH